MIVDSEKTRIQLYRDDIKLFDGTKIKKVHILHSARWLEPLCTFIYIVPYEHIILMSRNLSLLLLLLSSETENYMCFGSNRRCTKTNTILTEALCTF